MRKSWLACTWAFSRATWTKAAIWAREKYSGLKNRYGPGYTHALPIAALLALLLPVPGSSVLAVVLVVIIAEIHRTIAKKVRSYQAFATEKFVMSFVCDITLKRNATSAQLAALGAALWRWSSRDPWKPGIYQYLDNQVLADLIAGKEPTSGQSPRQSEQRSDGIHFGLRDTGTYDRQATIDSLRQEIPSEAVADIVVDGASWKGSKLPGA
jgi:hypothetical protein